LITHVAKDVNGSTKSKWGDQEIDWANWQRLTMREAIVHYWPQDAGTAPSPTEFSNVDAFVQRLKTAEASLQPTPHEAPEPYPGDAPEIREATAEIVSRTMATQPYSEEARKIRERLAVRKSTFRRIAQELEVSRNIGRAIADLFESIAEEHLVQPTIIYEFPTAVSPLSKQKADEPDWTERWEIFAGQMEIANGFSELNDPEDQRRRFEQQLKERERGDEEAHQMDEDYIRALSYGMPPAGGVGVGVDRLAMLLTDSHTIRDVILFPLLRPEKANTEDTKE